MEVWLAVAEKKKRKWPWDDVQGRRLTRKRLLDETDADVRCPLPTTQDITTSQYPIDELPIAWRK
jgi:hypothetical protein